MIYPLYSGKIKWLRVFVKINSGLSNKVDLVYVDFTYSQGLFMRA
jgi:archaellin